jgi:hypothetical protein
MNANDLPTVGYLDKWLRAINTRVEAIAQRVTPATTGEVVFFSVHELAQRLKVDASAVRKWLRVGKRGLDGSTIRLQAFYFNSEPRIPWPAAVAYALGEPFDLAALPAPSLPTQELAEVPLPLDEPPLRLAS